MKVQSSSGNEAVKFRGIYLVQFRSYESDMKKALYFIDFRQGKLIKKLISQSCLPIW